MILFVSCKHPLHQEYNCKYRIIIDDLDYKEQLIYRNYIFYTHMNNVKNGYIISFKKEKYLKKKIRVKKGSINDS